MSPVQVWFLASAVDDGAGLGQRPKPFCYVGLGSMTLVNDMLDYTENNVQYVQYGCLVWLDM